MSIPLQEPMQDLFKKSELMILDFDEIPTDTPPERSIKHYFEQCAKDGLDPTLPQQRQAFNNSLLAVTGKKYLVSRYGEDRSSMLRGSRIAKEKRTIHMGIDIFSKELEKILAPCDGEIVEVGNEPQDHSFGHFLVLRPTDASLPYMFFGHLSANSKRVGHVKRGEQIAVLGDYVDHENGGWSRHLHLQMIRTLPEPGKVPVGYMTRQDFDRSAEDSPDVMPFFPQWKLQRMS